MKVETVKEDVDTRAQTELQKYILAYRSLL